VDSVVPDNSGGIQKAFQHLTELGHTRIGYLRWARYLYNFDIRWVAYKTSMDTAGFPIQPHYVLEVPNGINQAAKVVGEYLDQTKDLPTAFLADNDLFALGAMAAFQERNLQVGRDISIVGFDDVSFAKLSAPPLTTVQVFNEEMGTAAVERLLDLIQMKTEPRLYTVSTKLCKRSSVANLIRA